MQCFECYTHHLQDLPSNHKNLTTTKSTYRTKAPTTPRISRRKTPKTLNTLKTLAGPKLQRRRPGAGEDEAEAGARAGGARGDEDQ